MDGIQKKRSKLPAIFLLCLLAVCILCASLWVALKKGISIDRIEFASIAAEEIHVQLKDGFNLSISRLSISSKEEQTVQPRPGVYITRFNEWAHLINEIRINEILFRDKKYFLEFAGKEFNISGDDFGVKCYFTFQNEKVEIKLSRLEIQPYLLTLFGKAVYDQEKNELSFSGGFTRPDIAGEIDLSYTRNRVVADVQTEQFSNLAGILAELKVHTNITSWIAESITTSGYRISQLKLDIAFKDGKPVIEPKSIFGKAVATGAAIRFDPSLPPVETEKIYVTYENDRLSFDLEKPFYKTKDLAGSRVEIFPLLGKGPQLDIDIKTTTKLDDDILELLRTYDIRLPFIQHTGVTQGDLSLLFDLPSFACLTGGEFTTGQGEWTLGATSYTVNRAKVLLKNDFVAIKALDVLENQSGRSSLTGSIDITARKAKLTADIEKLGVERGQVTIDFTNPEKLQFFGSMNTTVFPLSAGDKPITEFTFKGSSTSEKMRLTVNDGEIILTKTDRLNVKLANYLVALDAGNVKEEAGVLPTIPIRVSGPAVSIKWKDNEFTAHNYKAKIIDGRVIFVADIGQGELRFESSSEGINLVASKIETAVLQKVFTLGKMEGGEFDFTLRGPPENLEGYFEFRNVLLKKHAAMNNALAFINAIPALATLSSPGFDKDGYRIKEGIMHFGLKDKVMTLHEMRTDGATINTEIQGWVDFNTDVIDLKVELISLKDYSKIISKIPLAGYAILGPEGTISTSLDIYGSRTEPEVNVNMAREIGMLPVNIVKRVLKWPSTLIDKLEGFVDQEEVTREQEGQRELQPVVGN